MSLEIALLGRPYIRLHGQPPAAINANKALALIYYLAATGRPQSRQALAGLLWSDLAEDAARRNLRVELNRLRTVFDAYLRSDRESLAFNRGMPHQLDLALFEACANHPEPTLDQLRSAVDLYQGDFLEDFYIRDAALFEEWQAAERERLRKAWQQLTLRLVNACAQARDYNAAIAYAQRLMQREPWLEEGHQQLMAIYARTGQRGAALAQFELCAQALNDEFGVPPSDATNDLYDRILAGEIGPDIEAAPPLSLAPQMVAPPFQPPAQPLHFVGRENMLATLRAEILQPGDNTIFALVGMGGVGKSTLAAYLGHSLRGEFPDGVLWAHVATSDPLDVLSNWARAFGYDFSNLSDVENRAAALRGVLAQRRVLLVLDDVRSVARSRPLLVGGAQCATLITTRDLDVATALNARPHRLDELTPDEGVRLLTRILGEARVNAELAAAQSICAQLQHLPLAVEITAQRLVSRPRRRLADTAERLRNVEERLDLSISDRAVRTSFQVSWESLDANLRRIFALLGVFEGRSFAVGALAHIAGLDRYTAEDRLFALTALSLISEESEERYRQHPLLADFAREQLGDNPLPLVEMALYYQQYAEQRRTDYAALRPEWENLMAGMEKAHELAQWQLVLQYAESLNQAWFTRARYTQARTGYGLARDAAKAIGDEEAAAQVALHWGQACVEQDDHEEARLHLIESLSAQQPAICAQAYYLLGRIAIEQGDHRSAAEMLHKSRQLRIAIHDDVGVAAVSYQEALLSYRRGQYDESRALCEQALAIQVEAGDRAASLPTLRLLVDIALEQETYEIANSYCLEALTLCDQLQDRGELAATYYSAAVVARFQNQLDVAKSYAEKAIELCRWMGNRNFLALTLYELSRIYLLSEEREQAFVVIQESIQLTRELQNDFSLVYGLLHLGNLHHALGRLDDACNAWEEALSLAKNHPLEEDLKRLLGEQCADS